MSDFEITSQKLPYRNLEKGEQDIMLIQTKGRLDTETVPDLQKVLDDCLALRIYRFIVDLSELAHMGSAGVGAFIGILDTLEQNKGTIVFVRPTPKVKDTFYLFKLSNFYSITDDIQTALDKLREKRQE